MNQEELWDRVKTIKRNVRDEIGTELSHEFRSDNIYQSYTGLCGEAQMAHDAEELTDEIVTMLEEYAEKVIDLYKQNHITVIVRQ